MKKTVEEQEAYEEGFLIGMRTAAGIAFDVESSYAPHRKDDDSPCCRCPVSHAKSDGAAEVVNAIQERLKY